jgi:LDH2 family malate/lactate/ureidoglycolate dehydrogenase
VGGTPVFLQIINPEFFAGRTALEQETSWLAQACRASRPRDAGKPVRMPGDSANALRSLQMADGVALYPSILPELNTWAEKLHVELPHSIS